MEEATPESKLYWTGGLFRTSILCWPKRQQHQIDKAIAILDEFRSACQKQFIAFEPTINGRPMAYERFSKQLNPEHRDNRFSVGAGLPDAEQLPGRSTIASITQGELLEGLKKGGDFDNQHAKAVIVFIYHLWDESYRVRIADSLGVKPCKVTCDLMGDLREIRNAIIHNSSIIEEKTLQKLKFLLGIWQIESAELVVTGTMLHALMEQLNAIRVDITE